MKKRPSKYYASSSKRGKKKKAKKQELSNFNRSLLFVIKNLVTGLLFFYLLSYTYTNVEGYKWLIKDLLGNNIKIISKYSKAPHREKMYSKVGFQYRYFQNIRANTPDSAIILFPFSQEDLDNKKIKLDDFKKPRNTIMSKSYITSFLYPRKVVFYTDLELQDHPYAQQYTHTAIVAGKGYERIPQYQNVVKRPKHAIVARVTTK
jgi:hypothetical protein